MRGLRETLALLLAAALMGCVDTPLREAKVGLPPPPALPGGEPCPTCSHREVELWGRESLGAERVNRTWPHVHRENDATTGAPR